MHQAATTGSANRGCVVTLAILGGGVRSAAWYYQALQQELTAARGALHEQTVVLWSMPFGAINECLPHDMVQASRLLAGHCAQLVDTIGSPYTLANITLHEAFDQMPARLAGYGEPVHLRDVINHYWPAQRQRAFVLGTRYTMEAGYLRSLFAQHAVDWQTADAHDLAAIDALRRELFVNDAHATAQHVLHALQAKYPTVDQWIVGCTELALAVPAAPPAMTFFHVPQLQCRLLAAQARR